MWGYQNMAGWGGFWFLGTIFWAVIFIDLILLGMWLWKQLNKK